MGEGMKNPRPRSKGFIVVNIKTREILSEISKRREPAREIARRLESPSCHVGVHQVMLYPGQEYDRATYKP